VVIPTKYKDPHGWADCVDGFIRVVKQTDKMHIVPVVLATVPVLDPAGFIGLRGNGLTRSKIVDFLTEPSL